MHSSISVIEFFISDWSFLMCFISIFMFSASWSFYQVNLCFPFVHWVSLNKQCFELPIYRLIVSTSISLFFWSFVLFIHLGHFLLFLFLFPHFGCCSLYICFCVLGWVAFSHDLGRVALHSRSPMGPSGIATLVTLARLFRSSTMWAMHTFLL